MPTKPLDRLMFAQGARCFFCEQPLSKDHASVEHLVASSKGGGNGDDNRVVCCKAINALLGNMSIKEKIQVVLRQKGQFKCPNGSVTPAATGSTPRKAAPQKYREAALSVVLGNLQHRGNAKPRTLKTLTNTVAVALLKDFPDIDAASIVQKLQASGKVTLTGTKVSYDL